MDLKLNIRSPALKGLYGNDNGETLRAAVERKMLHKETFEEAWQRIFAMKNSDLDVRRLKAVKQAMEDGKIGRDPERASRRFSKAEALDLSRIIDEMKARERLRKMVEDTPDNYRLITDWQAFDAMIDVMASEELIVFDIESTGVDVYSDYIVGHVLTATKADMHYYIPTRHSDEHPQLDDERVAERLRPIYESASIKKIAHNAK